MNYILDGKEFYYSYQDLKSVYKQYCLLSDREFLKQLKDIIHFACFVSYIKELSSKESLSDTGIVHQLVHLLCLDEPVIELKEIREQFEIILKLA